MTAAEVPRGATLILGETYDSREGFCGLLRIRAEALQRLRRYGFMPKNAGYVQWMHQEGPIGYVTILVEGIGKEYLCHAPMQPLAECELLIYEQSVQPAQNRPGK